MMKQKQEKKILAGILVKSADRMLAKAANSRCMLILHQPIQPEDVRKFRKF